MRSLPQAVLTARERCRGPLSIHAVMGQGRSYGIEAGYLGKKFLGIFCSALWDELPQEETPATLAFLTDIGNDLAYEIPVAEVLEWVTQCLERLRSRDARVVITALPLDALQRVGRHRFALLQKLFFPRCRLTQSELVARAEQLDAALRELAESQKTPIFSAPNAWYGCDPIHPRRVFLRDWWRAQFNLIAPVELLSQCGGNTWLQGWYLRCLQPPTVTAVCGKRSVPLWRITLHDGTRITLS